MLVVKKNLRVSERFPYPVRVEAVLELIDQLPVRRLEKMTRKGSNIRFCNAAVSLTARSGKEGFTSSFTPVCKLNGANQDQSKELADFAKLVVYL